MGTSMSAAPNEKGRTERDAGAHPNSFRVIAEDGTEHQIHISDVADGSPVLNAGVAAREQHLIMRTSTGSPVNHLGKGSYEILTDFGSVRAASDDPEAP